MDYTSWWSQTGTVILKPRLTWLQIDHAKSAPPADFSPLVHSAMQKKKKKVNKIKKV